ncbi:MAG: hypothetical protein Q9212_001832 [Teloschistes hypoglaucus]
MSPLSAPAPMSAPLKQLSPTVFLSEPALKDTTQQQTASNNQPEAALPSPAVNPSRSPASSYHELIILFTWMSAHQKHIYKYVEGYRTRYPNAKIFVALSSPADIFYRRTSTQRRLLAPVVEAVRSSSCAASRTVVSGEPKILLHTFSNGGSYQARNFFLAYAAATAAVPGFPAHSKILDSGPGRATFGRSVLALSSALPHAWPIHFLLLALIYVVMSGYWIVFVPLGLADPLERARCALNDRDWMHGEKKRCYINSMTDPIVGWADVEAHARDASKKGFDVRCERFEETGHCAHVKADGGMRYWNIVHTLWNGEEGEKKGMAPEPKEDNLEKRPIGVL